jgi:hypothetical protein
VRAATVSFLVFLLLLAQAAQASPQANTKSAPQASDQKTTTSRPVAPSPDEGTVDHNRYTSDYFAFTYLFPEQFEVMEDLMEGEEDEAKQAFVLLAAYGPPAEDDTRQGIVIFADKLEQAGRDTGGPSGYFAKLTGLLEKDGAKLVVANQEYTFAGRRFARAELHRAGEDEGIQAILVTLDRGYALGFQFVASSEAQIDSLIASLNTLKFTSANVGAHGPGKSKQ